MILHGLHGDSEHDGNNDADDAERLVHEQSSRVSISDSVDCTAMRVSMRCSAVLTASAKAEPFTFMAGRALPAG